MKEVRHFSFISAVNNATTNTVSVNLDSIKNPGVARLKAAWVTAQFLNNITGVTELGNVVMSFPEATVSKPTISGAGNSLNSPVVNGLHGRVDFEGECLLPTSFTVRCDGYANTGVALPASYVFFFFIDFELEIVTNL